MTKRSINYFIFFPGVIFSFFLQITFIPAVLPENLAPNLLLAALIAGAYFSQEDGILYAAFMAGYAMDINSGKYFGAIMISLVISVFAMMSAKHYILKNHFNLYAIMAGMACATIFNISYYFLTYIINSRMPLYETSAMVVSSMSDMALVAILFYPLVFIFSHHGNVR